MAGPLMHMVVIDAEAGKIYEALSTTKGLAIFWTADSHAELGVWISTITSLEKSAPNSSLWPT